MDPVSLLRINAVVERCGLSRSQVYERGRLGAFPRPIRVAGTRSVRWISSEIDQWIGDQIRAARGDRAA